MELHHNKKDFSVHSPEYHRPPKESISLLANQLHGQTDACDLPFPTQYCWRKGTLRPRMTGNNALFLGYRGEQKLRTMVGKAVQTDNHI